MYFTTHSLYTTGKKARRRKCGAKDQTIQKFSLKNAEGLRGSKLIDTTALPKMLTLETLR
jgi:hypothetical protein